MVHKGTVTLPDGLAIHCTQFQEHDKTAALRTTTSCMSSLADGWKAKTIGLQVFNEINDLKIAVDVGFVVGVIPQTTPTGSAIRQSCYRFDNANSSCDACCLLRVTGKTSS